MTSQLSTLNSQPAAPAMQDAEPIFTAQQLEEMLMRRGNPLPQLTAQTLTSALDAFDLGYLQPASRLWEKLVTRDRWLKTVKDKREEAIELRPVLVEKTEDSPDAENQQRVLEVFFANVRAAHATNRHMTGGLSKLFAQMMESVSTMYAIHHLLWEPDAEQTFDLPHGGSVPALKLTAEFVPLEYFEARTGALRFLGSDVGYYGAELQPGHWMTTTGPGLLIAASIAIWEARLARHDRMNLSEKWGQPAILGHTTSAKDSNEGRAMKAAVTSIAANYRGVNYGAAENKIESFWPSGGGGGSHTPMKEILDDVKRDIITLYLGSDLSTMSRGQAVGASVQQESTDDKQAADCLRIADTINSTLVPIVIKWYFGDSARVLAKLTIEAPDNTIQAQLLANVQGLAALMPPDTGIAIEPVAKRLGVPIAKEGEAMLKNPTQSPDATYDPTKDKIFQRERAFHDYRQQQKPAVNAADDSGGHWVTVHGSPIFIKDGQSADDAISDHFGGKKAEGKDSQSTAKKGTIPHADDHGKHDAGKRPGGDAARASGGGQGRGKSSGDAKAGDAGGGARSGAGAHPASAPEGLAKPLAKAAKADAADRRGSGSSHQRAALHEAADKGVVSRTARNDAKKIAEGGEHHVELSGDGSRVMKHTKDGMHGFVPDVNKDGNIIHRTATPSEYIARQTEQEKIFPTGLKFEGVQKDGGLTYSQKFLKGTAPTPDELHGFMTGAGFQKVGDANIFSTTLSGTTYFNPNTGHVAGDAKPDNFVKTEHGIVPHDLMVVRAKPGTPLHKAMSASIGKNLAHNAAPQPSGPDSPAMGRLLATARMNFGEALAEDLQPLRTAIAHCLQGDDATLPARAAALLATLNDAAFSARLIAANGSSDALEEILAAAIANGLANGEPVTSHQSPVTSTP